MSVPQKYGLGQVADIVIVTVNVTGFNNSFVVLQIFLGHPILNLQSKNTLTFP